MTEMRYIISDASKKIDVEPHVLRYWEEELNLNIPRNEMGHRYYTEQDIRHLKAVKVLKEQGFQLKAIKLALPDINRIETLDADSILELKEELNRKAFELEEEMEEDKQFVVSSSASDTEVINTKMDQFKGIMTELIVEALKENNADLSSAVGSTVSDRIVKELDYLMRLKEEREEEQFKKFDESIRECQKNRAEVAATGEDMKKGKRGLFGRRKREKKKRG